MICKSSFDDVQTHLYVKRLLKIQYIRFKLFSHLIFFFLYYIVIYMYIYHNTSICMYVWKRHISQMTSLFMLFSTHICQPSVKQTSTCSRSIVSSVTECFATFLLLLYLIHTVFLLTLKFLTIYALHLRKRENRVRCWPNRTCARAACGRAVN